ncbi:choice-of-anchor L domain-containing protein, partial [Paenimyroides marinum]|uniref:choice-of-anchor L domain-containing protein n=1 Tax=Paenimyroides marinum TaxID=1159016 RepID=UPI0015A545E7
MSNVRYQYGSGVPASNAVKAAGYFNRNGSDFPFEDGIVLATDMAVGVEGPCTPGGGPTSPNQFRWTGDQDLIDLINDAGGWPTTPVNPSDMRSTVIDFEFIPVQNTVNFEYLFGSHSYNRGCNFDCGNGAMFGAWLIDLTTGVGENIARIPGVNSPISINTLRDNDKTDPINCAAGVGSINPLYFGNAYGTGVNQVPAIAAPINLSGHTIAMTSLTANVIVGRKYKIKLAVIDFCPSASHTSAVFFKAGSFDIGNLDLGDPVLIENGEGLCVGDSYTLESGLDPNLFTFEWYKDGVKIPGQTGANLVVTETGDYYVKGFIPSVTNCVMESDPVRIEFHDYVNISTPQNLTACPNAGSETRFDLTDAVSNVTSNPDILFNFYTS